MPDESSTRSAPRPPADWSARAGAHGEQWPRWWVLCALTTVISLAAWQRTPGWIPLVVAGLSTCGAAGCTRFARAPRAWAVGAVLALAGAVAISARETWILAEVTNNWAVWSENEREARGQRVAQSLSEVSAELQRDARRAVGDSMLLRALDSGTTNRFVLKPPSIEGGVESALLIFRRERLIARAGQSHTPIAAFGNEGTALVAGPFHSSLVSRAVSPTGDVQAVAIALVSSAPPADRFVVSLSRALAGRFAIDRTVIESPDSARVIEGSTVVVVPDGPRRLARVRALAYSKGETREALLQRARARCGIPLAFAVLLVLVTSWRRPARTVHRVGTTVGLLGALAVAPLAALSNVSTLFDASSYFAAMGGPLTANLAALLITSALLLATLFLVMRSDRALRITQSRAIALALVLLVAALGPFLLRDLARGIHLPQSGPGTRLWMAWQLAIALAGVSVLLAGATAGQAALGRARGVPAMTAPLLAITAAAVAPLLWSAPGAWPSWYSLIWVLAIAALALTRRGVALVLGAAVVAGAGAATLTWGQLVRARMELAEIDLPRISAVDDNAYRLLQTFAQSLGEDPKPPQESDELLRRFAASDLAVAGYPARLARWIPSLPDTPVAEVSLAPISDTVSVAGESARAARLSGAISIFRAEDGPATVLIAAIPSSDGSVITVSVPPRTGLLPVDPFAALIGNSGVRGVEPMYRLTLTPSVASDTPAPTLHWRRDGTTMHGDGVIGGGEATTRRVHVEVELRSLEVLLPRGALLVLLDVAVVMLLWGASAMTDGAFTRWARVRRGRWARSYRVQLSATLLAFFVAPAAIFAAWSWYRLQDDDASSRELLVRESLRVAAAELERRELSPASSARTPLFLYRDGQLQAANDDLLNAIAPLGRLLPVTLSGDDFGTDDLFATRRLSVGSREALVGYRRVPQFGSDVILATPARGDEFALDARRADLGILVLFATALGALAAIWSSGIAARALARPVGVLREAALSIAAGRAAPALGTAPASEFAPVYRAFGRMAEDLTSSRAALEAAQRRTDAVLQNVASGVLALQPNGDILIANPRAEILLGQRVRSVGMSLASLPVSFEALVERCRRFLAGTSMGDSTEDAFELAVQGRQLRARLTRLPSGAVLTLDDVTELATAQRVLAWGEMARQVAHEIKNPLTPIRLGVQHLRRAFRDGRGDFGAILDTNVTRVLAEIDHLDEIARAFSRYGTAPADREPGVPVDVDGVVRDVLALEQLGEGDVTWTFRGAEDSGPEGNEAGALSLRAIARRDELKEVLLNVLENARLAKATAVTVDVTRVESHVMLRVHDNGGGIPSELLNRVFEPHFSTRTSGSGLGLAISRRLIEGWGGTIALTSTVGVGTDVEIMLLASA